MIKNLIFDFDGTLVDSSSGIFESFKSSCIKYKLNIPNKDFFKEKIGPPINKLIYDIFPEIENKKKEKFIQYFRSEYDYKFYLDYQWYEGALDTINCLIENYDRKAFIVTNKPTLTCLKILKDSKIQNLFNEVIGIDYMIFTKVKKGEIFSNKSIALDYLFSKTNIKKSQSIYIGDTLNDKLSSEKSNLRFIAAKYGFYDWNKNKEQLVESIDAIIQLKERINL